MKTKAKITPERIYFIDNYGELNDSQTLQEILFIEQQQLWKLEKIRSNTSTLVWWLIAVPIIIGICIGIVSILN